MMQLCVILFLFLLHTVRCQSNFQADVVAKTSTNVYLVQYWSNGRLRCDRIFICKQLYSGLKCVTSDYGGSIFSFSDNDPSWKSSDAKELRCSPMKYHRTTYDDVGIKITKMKANCAEQKLVCEVKCSEYWQQGCARICQKKEVVTEKTLGVFVEDDFIRTSYCPRLNNQSPNGQPTYTEDPYQGGGQQYGNQDPYGNEQSYDNQQPPYSNQPSYQNEPQQPQYDTQPQYSGEPQFGGEPSYGGEPQYGSEPQYSGEPQYGGQPQYGEQPQYVGEPQYGEDPQFGNQPPYYNEQPYYEQQPPYDNEQQYGNPRPYYTEPPYYEVTNTTEAPRPLTIEPSLTPAFTPPPQEIDEFPIEEPESFEQQHKTFTLQLLQALTNMFPSENLVISPISVMSSLDLVPRKQTMSLPTFRYDNGPTITNMVFYEGEPQEREDPSRDVATRELNFSEDSEDAAEKINQWLKENTNGEINKVIDKDNFDKDVDTVTANTMYLDRSWSQPFDESKSVLEKFTSIDGTEDDVVMMKSQQGSRYKAKYFPELQATAVELPYENSPLCMRMLIPDENTPLSQVEENLTPSLLEELENSLEEIPLELTMPQINYSCQKNLKNALDQTDYGQSFNGVTEMVHYAQVDIGPTYTKSACGTGGFSSNPDDQVETFPVLPDQGPQYPEQGSVEPEFYPPEQTTFPDPSQQIPQSPGGCGYSGGGYDLSYPEVYGEQPYLCPQPGNPNLGPQYPEPGYPDQGPQYPVPSYPDQGPQYPEPGFPDQSPEFPEFPTQEQNPLPFPSDCDMEGTSPNGEMPHRCPETGIDPSKDTEESATPKSETDLTTPKSETETSTPKAETAPITPKETEPTTPKAETEPTTPKAETEPTTPKAETEPITPKAETEPTTPKATNPTTPKVETEPTTPKAETEPTTPKPMEPTTPKAETEPTTPKAETEPTTPKAETEPTKPEATEPTTPKATDPTTPKVTEPTTPKATELTTLKATEPTTPKATEPTTPKATETTITKATEPTTPKATEPTTPNAETEPTTPKVTDPTTPKAETEPTTPKAETEPTTPKATGPTTPKATEPTTPKATEPTTPKATEPTTPKATEPTTPTAETEPTTPKAETEPTTPKVTEPTTPKATEPTTPTATEPTTPKEETEPTTPKATEPTTQKAETEPTTPKAETEPTTPKAETEPTTPKAETEPTESKAETEPTTPNSEMEETTPASETESIPPKAETEETTPETTDATSKPEESLPDILTALAEDPEVTARKLLLDAIDGLELKANGPFIFFIQDTISKQYIFVGRVTQ